MIRFVAVLSVAALAGCGSPFLHPASTGASLSDPGLIGEWVTSDDISVRAVVSGEPSEAADRPYSVTLTVRDKGDPKTTLTVDCTLTEINGSRYADLFLAQPERDNLVGAYGFLVLPVHQIMRVARDGDRLTVWSFRGDWLDDRAYAGVVAHDRVTVGGGSVAVVTSSTERIRDLLARHGQDPKAFGDPIVFQRVRR